MVQTDILQWRVSKDCTHIPPGGAIDLSCLNFGVHWCSCSGSRRQRLLAPVVWSAAVSPFLQITQSNQNFCSLLCFLSVGRRSFETLSQLGRPCLRHTFIHHFLWHTDTPSPHPLWLCVFAWVDPVVLSAWTFENINAYVFTFTSWSLHILCKFQIGWRTRHMAIT